MTDRRPAAGGVGRAQRALAAMAATVIGLTALAIVALLICRAVGVPQSAFTSGPLQLLAVLPLPGLAIGLVLLLSVVVVSVVARTRSQRP
jgi:hypothetical protein